MLKKVKQIENVEQISGSGSPQNSKAIDFFVSTFKAYTYFLKMFSREQVRIATEDAFTTITRYSCLFAIMISTLSRDQQTINKQKIFRTMNQSKARTSRKCVSLVMLVYSRFLRM